MNKPNFAGLSFSIPFCCPIKTTIGITFKNTLQAATRLPTAPSLQDCFVSHLSYGNKLQMCLLSKLWVIVAARATLSKAVNHIFVSLLQTLQWLAIKHNAPTVHSNSLHWDGKSFSEHPHSDYVKFGDLCLKITSHTSHRF